MKDEVISEEDFTSFVAGLLQKIEGLESKGNEIAGGPVPSTPNVEG